MKSPILKSQPLKMSTSVPSSSLRPSGYSTLRCFPCSRLVGASTRLVTSKQNCENLTLSGNYSGSPFDGYNFDANENICELISNASEVVTNTLPNYSTCLSSNTTLSIPNPQCYIAPSYTLTGFWGPILGTILLIILCIILWFIVVKVEVFLGYSSTLSMGSMINTTSKRT